MNEQGIEKYKDAIAKKYGMIYCYGPNGEYFEARSSREAQNKTGVHRNTILYAINHSGMGKGWKFERYRVEAE